MCTGLQRNRDLFFAPLRFDVTFGSPQNQMFTGLQRKRPLFFTPQRLNVTFALRPGRNGCFFLKRSLVCSENVDFFTSRATWATFARRPSSKGRFVFDSSLVCTENVGFFHLPCDPNGFCLKSAAKRPLKWPNVSGLQRKRHQFSSSKKRFFFISINLQWKWNYHAFHSVFWSILSFSLQVYHHRDDRLPHVCSENAFVRKASLVCSQTMPFLMQFYKKKVLKRRPFFPKTYLLLLIVSLAKVPPVCSQTSFFRFRRFFWKIKSSKSITIVTRNALRSQGPILPDTPWLQPEACFFFEVKKPLVL